LVLKNLVFLGFYIKKLKISKIQILGFYSASALLAVQTAVLARPFPSVRLSFGHVPVLCPDEWRYDRVVFSVW